jgi:hypothetical protein
MILTDEEMDERLNSPDNLATNLVEVRSMRANSGRTVGSTKIPPALRSLIGSIAVQGNEPQADVAEVFGVAISTVNLASRGLIRNDGPLQKDLVEDLDEAKDRANTNKKATVDEAHEAAVDAMVASLSILTTKLKSDEGQTLKPKELSRIAADMSKVVSGNKKDDPASNIINNTKVIVYSPAQNKERAYEVIEA